jgi:hypothetical protein
MRQTNAGA